MPARLAFKGIDAKDLGLDKVFRTIKRPTKPITYDVGIQGKKAELTKNYGRGNRSKLTNVQIAAIHEFGSPGSNIPKRSFLRAGFDKNKKKYKEQFKKMFHDFIENPTLGFLVKSLREEICQEYKQDTIKLIEGRIPPPLKKRTVQRKEQRKRRRRGSPGKKSYPTDLPLVDSAQMIRSFTVVRTS